MEAVLKNNVRNGKERRKTGRKFLPHMFIAFETLALFLALYCVNMGADIKDWNIITVVVVLVYFYKNSVSRYFRVLARNKG